SGREAEIEIETGAVALRLRAIPLLPGGERTGALVLLRDVTELRRRERALVSKDATIREIHHRVKNNLQTVAALLRMQARRLDVPEARHALEEAVRRVGSIALVHETLSANFDEQVAFDEVADRLRAMTVEVSTAGGGVRVRRDGSFGTLAADTATPLALVLTELLQNALEHGLGGSGSVWIRVHRSAQRLRVEVEDDGRGLPAGFDLAGSAGLGLSIVRTLVESELDGRLDVGGRAEAAGTRVLLEFPLP
ncbi:MAG: sensor histidine kinase, partial [Nocardioidaceae bacterium]